MVLTPKNMHFSKVKILMNLNVQNEWYNDRKNTKWGTSWATVCWTLGKTLSYFLFFYLQGVFIW